MNLHEHTNNIPELKIAVGLNFYQDFDSLRRLLQSLNCCAFDHIIAVDGKYKEWPDKKAPALSDKACVDLLMSMEKQTPVTYIKAPNKTQNEKRQLYLEACAPEKLGMDVIVILDTDDYILCDKTNYKSFKADLEYKISVDQTYRLGYCIPCHMWDQWPHPDLGGQVQNICRVFYQPHMLKYSETHFTLRHKQTAVIQVYSGAVICDHIEMAHDHKLRDETYQDTATTYSKRLYERENPGKSADSDSFNR